MNELHRQDDLDNQGRQITDGRRRNVFSVEQIQQGVLNAYSLDRVKLALRGHILANRDREPLEFLDNESNVQLTDAGRADFALPE